MYEEAEALYQSSIETRAKRLGEAHQDTVAACHNLAELYHAVGDTDSEHRVRQQLVRVLAQHGMV